MNSIPSTLSPHAAPASAPGELITDYRSRIALEQFQAEERRQRELAEQSSVLNAPEVRIRAWEKVHGLRLPSDPAHPVLSHVAAATDLTLEQVHQEQRQRSVSASRDSRASDRNATAPAREATAHARDVTAAAKDATTPAVGVAVPPAADATEPEADATARLWQV